MIEWINQLFGSKCKFWKFSCCEGAKAQLFKVAIQGGRLLDILLGLSCLGVKKNFGLI